MLFEEKLNDKLKEGIAMYARLTKILIDEGRTDDLVRASEDPEYRDSLIAQYEGLLVDSVEQD